MRSFKYYIVLTMCIIALIFSIGIPVICYVLLSDQVEEIVLDKNRMLAGEVYVHIESFLENRRDAARRLAHFSEAAYKNPDLSNFFDLSSDPFSNIVYALIKGKNEEILFEKNFSLVEDFTLVSKKTEFKDKVKNKVYFKTYISDKTGISYLGETIITDNLEMFFLVRLDSIQYGMVKSDFSKESVVLIVDSSGLVISARGWLFPPKSQESQKPLYETYRKKGELYVKDAAGRVFWADMRTIPLVGWTVLVGEPMETIDRIVMPVVYQALFWTILIFFIGLVFSFIAIIKITKNIYDFNKAIHLYTDGNYEVAFPKVAFSELDNLRSAFIEMGEAISLRENKLKEGKNQKELLLKELHHRVKNNLQIISSLLSLQEQYLFDERDAYYFKKMRTRICAMAIVHGNLYLQSETGLINIKAFLEEIFPTLSGEFSTRDTLFSVQGEEINLEIDRAIPLVLIISELITNSLRFAKKGKKIPEISVECSNTGETYKFLVRDNGKGLSKEIIKNYKFGNLANQPDFDPEGKTPGLGFVLIDVLLNQLSGKCEAWNEEGAVFCIEIPVKAE